MSDFGAIIQCPGVPWDVGDSGRLFRITRPSPRLVRKIEQSQGIMVRSQAGIAGLISLAAFLRCL